MKLKAVLLAGGEGIRLRPITATRPKPLVPVGGRPVIEYVLERLAEAGVRDVVIATSSRSEAIMQHLGGEYAGMNIMYAIDDEPLGTAGAVRKAGRFFKDTFIVASGDVLADLDIRELVACHKEKGALVTMALAEVDEPGEYGSVKLDEDADGSGRVAGMVEKPADGEALSNLVNAGVYVLNPIVLDLIPDNHPFDFSRDLFSLLIEKGEALFAHRSKGTWFDIGRPKDLLRANSEMTTRLGRPFVAANAEVAPSAYLDRASVGEGTRVLARVRVQRSIVLDNVLIESEAVVKDSIVGAGVRIGAGARVENSVVGDDVVIEPKAEVRDMTVAPGDVVQRLATQS